MTADFERPLHLLPRFPVRCFGLAVNNVNHRLGAACEVGGRITVEELLVQGASTLPMNELLGNFAVQPVAGEEATNGCLFTVSIELVIHVGDVGVGGWGDRCCGELFVFKPNFLVHLLAGGVFTLAKVTKRFAILQGKVAGNDLVKLVEGG